MIQATVSAHRLSLLPTGIMIGRLPGSIFASRSAMHESERLSALIGDIYDAALDSTLWVDVLGKTKNFIGGQGAGLGWKDAVAKRGGLYYHDNGLSEYYCQL